MSDFSSTLAPNKCVLANSGGTNIFVGCCENGKKLRKRADKQRQKRAAATCGTDTAGLCCKGKGGSAALCRGCNKPRRKCGC